MWYEKLGIVSIGVQNGGPDDGGLGAIKVDLWRSLCRYCHNSHCASVAHYALVLRVGGQFIDFNPEGIEKVRRNKRDRVVSADIIIPQTVWHGKTRNQLRDYLVAQVRAALRQCVVRLRKDKETVDESGLLSDIDASVAEFTQTYYDRDA